MINVVPRSYPVDLPISYYLLMMSLIQQISGIKLLNTFFIILILKTVFVTSTSESACDQPQDVGEKCDSGQETIKLLWTFDKSTKLCARALMYRGDNLNPNF